MGYEVLYCSKCQVQLRGREFDQGEAFRLGVRAVCKKCAPEVLKSLPPDQVQVLLKQMVVASKKPVTKPAREATGRIPMAEGNPASVVGRPRSPSLAALWVGLGLVFVLVLGLAVWVFAGSSRPPVEKPPAPAPAKVPRATKESGGPKEARPPVPPPKPPADIKEAGTKPDPSIPGLVGHWKFDEGSGVVAADASASGNRGALANGPAWVPGKRGTALSFDGNTAVANLESGRNLEDLHKSGMTVCAWILARDAERAHILDTSNSNFGWILAWKSDCRVEYMGDYFPTQGLRLLSAGTLDLNVWYHVAVTWDGSASAANAHLYVNGAAADGKGTNGVGALRDGPSTPLSIGNRRRQDRGFNGLIDDVRVYNRVLKPSEIAVLFSGSPD